MAETASPRRPQWFWPVVAVVVLVLAAGGFAAPSVLECSSSTDGFGTCINSKLADLGLARPPAADSEPTPESVAVAQPADTVVMPDPSVKAPDFGVRVEPNGSILIAGSGASGKTVEIYVNGELYGTAEVDPSGDWVLVPDAPLPPGGYELTLVDPETGTPFEKSFVVAINEDLSSEPLVVASAPGEASEILQGLAAPTLVAEAETTEQPATEPEPAPAEETAVADEPATAVATAEPVAEPVEEPAATEQVELQAPAVAEADPVVAEAEPAASEPVAEEDVVGDVAALENRIEALGALTPPSIDAVEIDGGRNYFAGTGADGAVIRLYVDNIFVADAEVSNGRWLLETDDVLKNRSQRVRVDQLLSGTADVASRAEIDFIFEEPAGVPADTAVAEAPITVPLPDYAIDTDAPVLVPVEPVAEPVVVAEAEPAVAAEPAPATEPAAATKPAADATAADTAVAEASVVVPEPDFGIDTDEPIPDEAIVSEAPTVVAEAAPTASQPASEPVAPPPADNAGSSTLAGGTASAADASGTVAVASGGASVAVPEPDFSIDTGIPVTIVAEAEQPVSIAAEAAAEEPAPAVVEEPAPEETVVAEAEVPQLVAVPVGAPEFGRFATGKAIIRAGDNLWTIARRVYGTGVRYTQIYGANRDQIRDPDLIYPGQVFALPDGAGEADTASN